MGWVVGDVAWNRRVPWGESGRIDEIDRDRLGSNRSNLGYSVPPEGGNTHRESVSSLHTAELDGSKDGHRVECGARAVVPAFAKYSTNQYSTRK